MARRSSALRRTTTPTGLPRSAGSSEMAREFDVDIDIHRQWRLGRGARHLAGLRPHGEITAGAAGWRSVIVEARLDAPTRHGQGCAPHGRCRGRLDGAHGDRSLSWRPTPTTTCRGNVVDANPPGRAGRALLDRVEQHLNPTPFGDGQCCARSTCRQSLPSAALTPKVRTAWDMTTSAAARLMRLKGLRRRRQGAPADLVMLDAPDPVTALHRSARAGRLQARPAHRDARAGALHRP